MTGRRYADDVCMCGQHAYDIPACGWCVDDVRTTYVICHLKSPMKSHSRVVCTSSAHCPRVICMSSARHTHETSVPRLFQVKQQRTALLKKEAVCLKSRVVYYRPQTKLWEGNVFTGVCDSVHRGMPCPGGGAWSEGSAWSWGVPTPGGCGLVLGGCLEETPPRQLLLRAVHILLECILVCRLKCLSQCYNV